MPCSLVGRRCSGCIGDSLKPSTGSELALRSLRLTSHNFGPWSFGQGKILVNGGFGECSSKHSKLRDSRGGPNSLCNTEYKFIGIGIEYMNREKRLISFFT
ncbi:hypothetical protein ACOSQ2_001366 [Xanthoceras sorbifolium]